MTEALHWDSRAKHVRPDSTKEEEDAGQLALLDFALTPQALLIFYSAEFHRLWPSYEPEATYRFPYTRLKPRASLQPLSTGKNQ